MIILCVLRSRPSAKVLDAKKLPFEAGSFDLVVDKGTVDALLCDGTGTTNARQASVYTINRKMYPCT